jgi:hypothetical protein
VTFGYIHDGDNDEDDDDGTEILSERGVDPPTL